MRIATRIPTSGVALLLAAACASRKPPLPAPAHEAAPAGRSSFTFVFDRANPAQNLPEDVRLDRPVPEDTRTLPVYPERALEARAGLHREIVRIVVDVHGKVSTVSDSPVEASDGGPYAADFRRAVEDAVRAWTFRPGALRHVVPGNDLDGDGKPDYVVTTSWERVPVYYDFRFTFEIVEGKARVTRE